MKIKNIQSKISIINKYTLLIISILLLFSLKINAQVSGLSNSKLGVYNAGVISNHNVEFEPAFFHIVSKKTWDENGHLNDGYGSSDSAFHSTGLNFRFTYGLWDKLEIGTSISTDLQMSNWGLKYLVFSKNKIGLAILAGANIPFGNKVVDKSVRLADNITSVGGGGVITAQFSDKLSVDFAAQYMAFIQTTSEKHHGSYYINSEVGYYILNGKLQLIAGMGYQHSGFDTFTSSTLTFYPGVTIETGNNYVIVIGAPFDIYGRNSTRNNSFAVALTLTFN